MRKYILQALIIGMAIMPNLSLSAENTVKWWGAEIEGAPSIGFKLQGNTAQINIEDIAGLGGEVRSPKVIITCPSEFETHLATQKFLKILANKLVINGDEYECLPLNLKECSLLNFLFSMNGQDIKSIPLPQAPEVIEIKSILHRDLLAPLQKVIEILIKNFRENNLKECVITKGHSKEYRWKLSQPFNMQMNSNLMISKMTTIYAITSIACAENFFIKAGYSRDDYNCGGWFLQQASSIDSLKSIVKKLIESYNNHKINPAHYKEIFELKLELDPRHENSIITFLNKGENDREKLRLILHIEPKSIEGLISTDF